MSDLWKLPDDEKVVSTCIFQEQLIVATTHYVYRLVGDALVPIKFKEVE